MKTKLIILTLILLPFTAYGAVLTVNPTIDGRLIYTGSADWATTHDASSATAVQTAETNGNMVVTGKNGGGDFNIQRGAMAVFDTSALGSTATIATATLRVYITATGNGDNDGNDFVSVVKFTPATTTSVGTDDYDQFGTATGSAQYDISSISTSAYLDFELNATGISWISKTTTTVLGIREGHDILDDTYAGIPGTYNNIDGNWVESASNKPELSITYTTSTPASSRKLKGIGITR